MAFRRKLKIMSVSAEVDPFAKVGGLGDVGRSLPKALKRLSHEVTVVMPRYGLINIKKHQLELVAENLPLPKLNDEEEKNIRFNVYRGWLMENLPVYFIDNHHYFGRYKKVYGTKMDNERFYVFNLAVLALGDWLNYCPDILHCHDWQTGLIPNLLIDYYRDHPCFGRTASLYTIHNLAFQMGKNWWGVKNSAKDDVNAKLPSLNDYKLVSNLNFAKRGIVHADIINTVSEKYAEEILTKDFGEDLQRILQRRQKRLFGIINGIDYNDYNPLTDPGLPKHYSINSIELKKENKLSLQKKFNLPVDAKIPLLAMVSRVTEQKGFDLLAEILDQLMKMDVQLIIWGGGEKHYENLFKKTMRKYPKKFAANLELTTKDVTQVYAGSDIFLMPSRFEPCGLGQLISLRYGSVPVVHAVGGLVDTVSDFYPKNLSGNGFVFKNYDGYSLLTALVRALEAYRRPSEWHALVAQGMKTSSSWEIPAKKYVKLYQKVIAYHQRREK